jgi:hypothetical protein
MLKVKMLARHTGENGKMEQGLEYLLPSSYAFELVNHGLAEFVPLPTSPPVNVTHKPTKTVTMDAALREMRAKNQNTMDRYGKKRK